MSTEEDLATIQAVTDKIAGPMKVWVLFIDDSANGNEEHHSVYFTLEGALEAAQIDMEQVVQVKGAGVPACMNYLRQGHFLAIHGTTYMLKHCEVKP